MFPVWILLFRPKVMKIIFRLIVQINFGKRKFLYVIPLTNNETRWN